MVNHVKQQQSYFCVYSEADLSRVSLPSVI